MEDERDKIITSVYVDRIQWRKFQANCPIFYHAKPNEVLDQIIKETNLRNEGKSSEVPTTNYEGLIDERIKLKKREVTLLKLMQREVEKGHPVYDSLLNVAERLGTDPYLVKNIDEVLGEIKQYDLTESDNFNRSDLETFIEYIETIIQRRRVEATITEFRRVQSKQDSKNN